MGFFNELKKLAQPSGEDENEFFESGNQQEEAGPPIAPTERRESFFTDEEEAEPPSISIPKPSFHLPKRAERIQANKPLQQAAQPPQGQSSGFMLAKPKEFEDCTGIADSFALGKTIMLDLSQTDKVTSRRALDFLSGVAYARNGKLSRVSGMIYLVTPAGVDVSGEMMSQIESGGLYF